MSKTTRSEHHPQAPMSDRPTLAVVVACLAALPPSRRVAAVARGWRWAHLAGWGDLAGELARVWLYAVHRRGAPTPGPDAVWQVAVEP
jgi:hypothetical protein